MIEPSKKGENKYSTPAEAFNDPGLFGASALTLFLDLFGKEAMEWEPETVEIELRTTGAQPTTALMDRLMAAMTIVSTDKFHTSFEVWNDICIVLSFGRMTQDMLMPASLEDALWGCAEARMLEGAELSNASQFDPSIAKYVGELLSQAGIAKPPSVLNFATSNQKEDDERDMSLANDEMTFKSYWDNHAEVGGKLEDFVIGRTKELFSQLARLPLRTGDASVFANQG